MVEKTVSITAGELTVKAVFNDSRTAELIYCNLPISSTARKWGEEVYFTIDVHTEPENTVDTVGKGDLAYWPEGSAFCIFYGETPVSSGGKIIPAGPVEIIGKVISGQEHLREIQAGENITIVKNGE